MVGPAVSRYLRHVSAKLDGEAHSMRDESRCYTKLGYALAERGAMTMILAPLCLAITACSGAVMAPGKDQTASVSARNAAAAVSERREMTTATNKNFMNASEKARSTGAPAPAPKRSNAYAVSKILGKKDRTLAKGDRICEISFVYAGRGSENLFWDEPCAEVTAKMMEKRELEELGRWEKLDGFQRKFIAAMPDGKVLYVGGGFSASIYPVDETGTSIEVPVAD